MLCKTRRLTATKPKLNEFIHNHISLLFLLLTIIVNTTLTGEIEYVYSTVVQTQLK
jgi:hypothetical protein